MPSGSTPIGISCDGLAGGEIHDRDETVVFVRDVENFTVGRNVEEFRIGAGIELARHLERIGVDHGDLPIVAKADNDRLVIRRDDDASRTLAHVNRRHQFQARAINDGDCIVLLVGHENHGGIGLPDPCEHEKSSETEE